MKNIKRFFISPRRREIVDNTEVNRGLLHKAAKCDLEIFMPLGHAARSWLGHDHNSDVDFFSLPHGSGAGGPDVEGKKETTVGPIATHFGYCD